MEATEACSGLSARGFERAHHGTNVAVLNARQGVAVGNGANRMGARPGGIVGVVTVFNHPVSRSCAVASGFMSTRTAMKCLTPLRRFQGTATLKSCTSAHSPNTASAVGSTMSMSAPPVSDRCTRKSPPPRSYTMRQVLTESDTGSGRPSSNTYALIAMYIGRPEFIPLTIGVIASRYLNVA
jgi:hypothetical protein